MRNHPAEPDSAPLADADWFREPSRRERWIGAALFGAFGLWFAALFFVLHGWWFRWVILMLGAISLIYAGRHLLGIRARPEQ